MFFVNTSQALNAHTSGKDKLIVVLGWSHHMAKDASLFSLMNETKEENIVVANDYTLSIVGTSSVDCESDMIIKICDVPPLSSYLWYVPQIAQIGKKVEFWPNRFVMKDINNNIFNVAMGNSWPKGEII